jgi:beta-lactamase regulating signal transducer with metallopeptidase domain
VFFHPAVWLAHRRLRRERELACDLAVVQASADRRLPYAECLVKLVRWCFLARKNSPDAIGFSSSESMLTTRVA